MYCFCEGDTEIDSIGRAATSRFSENNCAPVVGEKVLDVPPIDRPAQKSQDQSSEFLLIRIEKGQ